MKRMGKMKTKIKHLVIVSLGFLLIFTSTCKRDKLEDPSPLGPSTIAVILNISASPNVINAGFTNQSTTITATLKKYNGVALSGKTLYFEIRDALGNKIDVGYFEGNKLVESKVTDENGVASVVYYGPYADEIADNTNVYIWVTYSSEGEELVANNTIVSIIRETIEQAITLSISPSVLFAGDKRESAIITAKTPFQYYQLIFRVGDENGDPIATGGGFFKGNVSVRQKRTDAKGEASVTYMAPLSSEVTSNTTVYIWVDLAAGITGKYSAPIDIVRDVTDVVLELYAYPNVLNATTKRPRAEIQAVAKKVDGAPLVGRKVYFEVILGPGKFSNNKIKTWKKVNQNGNATVVYVGPKANEIAGDIEVALKARLETNSPNWIHTEIPIKILKDYPKQ